MNINQLAPGGRKQPSLRLGIAVAFGVVAAYLAALVLSDSRQNLFQNLSTLLPVLPFVVAGTIAAVIVRAARWNWLLAQSGHNVRFGFSCLAYLSGFALTATPGKAGELVRARYFAFASVPHATVVSCFIVERVLDLLVLLAFAILVARDVPGFEIAVSFIAILIGAIAMIPRQKRLLTCLQIALCRLRLFGLARLVRVLFAGLEGGRRFLQPRQLTIAFALGFIGWGLQLIGIASAMSMLGIHLAPINALAMPAAAMLVGAASLMPGGVGSTEAAIVLILEGQGVTLPIAVQAAVAMRLGSLWFATLVGIAAVAWLEKRLATKLIG